MSDDPMDAVYLRQYQIGFDEGVRSVAEGQQDRWQDGWQDGWSDGERWGRREGYRTGVLAALAGCLALAMWARWLGERWGKR